jgi:hypothetical protein
MSSPGFAYPYFFGLLRTRAHRIQSVPGLFAWTAQIAWVAEIWNAAILIPRRD